MIIDRRTLLQLGACAGASLTLPSFASPPPARLATRLLIRQATVITMDPALGDMARADVLIDQGTIRAIGRQLPTNGVQVLDASGLIMIPGLVDSH
ncbi:hypothetical protein [Pseudomonas sp.]|uniref:hypothetical protein n=1 Tax=Pseudomonas sp. TaxID=306 RepID=UPI003C70BD19